MTSPVAVTSARSGTNRYSLLGHNVLSNIVLDGFNEVRADADCSLTVVKGDFEPLRFDQASFVHLEGPDGLRVVVGEVGEFRISSDGSAIEFALVPNALPSDVQYVVTGPVLSLALQLRGEPLLHAAGILVDGCSIALAADHRQANQHLRHLLPQAVTLF